jgi:molybdate transport repressor ModE-like protein
MRHHTTFRQLEIFEAIARLGSFTRASEELYLTQPTVSMQMKKLTDIVGAPLVEQVGKKVLLTEDGRELAQASRDIFAILDRYTMSVAQRQGLETGPAQAHGHHHRLLLRARACWASSPSCIRAST